MLAATGILDKVQLVFWIFVSRTYNASKWK